MAKESENSFKEKRRFPRAKAPIFSRPVGLLEPRVKVENVSLGGIRIYSDRFYKEKEKLEIEIFLPTNESLVEIVQVVWIKELPPNSEALYDIGLEFIRLSPEDTHKLKMVLEMPPDEQ